MSGPLRAREVPVWFVFRAHYNWNTLLDAQVVPPDSDPATTLRLVLGAIRKPRERVFSEDGDPLCLVCELEHAEGRLYCRTNSLSLVTLFVHLDQASRHMRGTTAQTGKENYEALRHLQAAQDIWREKGRLPRQSERLVCVSPMRIAAAAAVARYNVAACYAENPDIGAEERLSCLYTGLQAFLSADLNAAELLEREVARARALVQLSRAILLLHEETVDPKPSQHAADILTRLQWRDLPRDRHGDYVSAKALSDEFQRSVYHRAPPLRAGDRLVDLEGHAGLDDLLRVVEAAGFT